MLEVLEIQNLGIIKELNMDLQPGFTVITGETGSGKSMLLGAIEALQGERMSKDKIRTGSSKFAVRAIFNVDKKYQPELYNFLLEQNFLVDENEKAGYDMEISQENNNDFEVFTLNLSRELKQNGGNICRLNGTLINLQLMKQISSYLVDIHGQRDNQLIFDSSIHRKLLDNYGAEIVNPYLQAYRELYDKYQLILSKEKKLGFDEEQRKDLINLTKMQLKEIESINPQEDEDMELEKTIKSLQAKEKLALQLNAALQCFEAQTDDSSALGFNELASRIAGSLVNAAEIYSKMSDKVQLWENVITQSRDLQNYLEKILDSLDFDAELLAESQERLNLLKRLKDKYSLNINELRAYYNKKKNYLDLLLQAKEALQKLAKAKENTKKELIEKAKLLSEVRQKLAEKLQKEVEEVFIDLYMPEAKFKIQLDFMPEEVFNKDGMDKLEFLLEANKNEGFKSLAKACSGGEAARIMLALKSVLARADNMEVLIFDEIDSGVSGEAAAAVGKQLRLLSRYAQVICVTHSAYIASMAQNHYKIYKSEDEEGRIQSYLQVLTDSERVREISQLLSGQADIKLSEDLAMSLLNKARNIA